MLLDLTRQPIQVPNRQLTAVIQPGTVLCTPTHLSPGKEWVSYCPQALGMSFPIQAQFTPARGGSFSSDGATVPLEAEGRLAQPHPSSLSDISCTVSTSKGLSFLFML